MALSLAAWLLFKAGGWLSGVISVPLRMAPLPPPDGEFSRGGWLSALMVGFGCCWRVAAGRARAGRSRVGLSTGRARGSSATGSSPGRSRGIWARGSPRARAWVRDGCRGSGGCAHISSWRRDFFTHHLLPAKLFGSIKGRARRRFSRTVGFVIRHSSFVIPHFTSAILSGSDTTR